MPNTRLSKHLVAVAFCIIGTSCQQTPFDSTRLATLSLGKSSVEDVQGALGTPWKHTRKSDGQWQDLAFDADELMIYKAHLPIAYSVKPNSVFYHALASDLTASERKAALQVYAWRVPNLLLTFSNNVLLELNAVDRLEKPMKDCLAEGHLSGMSGRPPEPAVARFIGAIKKVRNNATASARHKTPRP